MMPHIEVDFLIAPLEPWRDLLMVELIELGYEGFEETMGGMKAYLPKDKYRASDLANLLVMRDPHVSVSRTVRELPDVNWNAQWESNFLPVEVDDRVRIHADFHPPAEGFRHQLVITPRMAFGTGHHATTRMMIIGLLDIGAEGKNVCDLGCGTGVLAILAEKMGAASVIALDNDPNAVENASQNALRNGCERVLVEKGGTDLGATQQYDIMLANIERNTLIEAMPRMAAALQPGGHLLLSGYVLDDQPAMDRAAIRRGLVKVRQIDEGGWACSIWQRKNDGKG